jgi:hypothetical protein
VISACRKYVPYCDEFYFISYLKISIFTSLFTHEDLVVTDAALAALGMEVVFVFFIVGEEIKTISEFYIKV